MLSLGQAILRGDREALALAVVIVVGVALLSLPAVLSLSGLVACWAVLLPQPTPGGRAGRRPDPAAADFVVAKLLGFAIANPEAPETQHRGAGPVR